MSGRMSDGFRQAWRRARPPPARRRAGLRGARLRCV